MGNRYSTLGLAIATGLGLSGNAGGAVYTATLTQVISYSPNGSVAGALGSSTATWQYDDASGELTQTGGVFNVRFGLGPTTLFRHTITGLLIGAGAPAAAESFVCTEGTFGTGVGASLCGNYRFGANAIDESTVTWGPGTSYSRTLGGDDLGIPPRPFPPPQNITAYDGFVEQSLSGAALAIGNSSCVTVDGQVDCLSGYDWRLTLADASPDTSATAANTPTAPIDVLANDPGVSDPVTVAILAPPDQGGTVAILNGGNECAEPCTGSKADLRLVLTPAAPSGADAYTEAFTYQVTDGLATASAEVRVEVAADDATPEVPADDLDSGLRADGGGSAMDRLLVALLGVLSVFRRGLRKVPE
ncbi:MAG: hypothetical protein L6Q83_08085 [Gammaproteobacteria bacterium]|nr:hypothetical protein [Gammaproteobacteria bacterium]